MRFVFPLFLIFAACTHLGVTDSDLGNDRHSVTYVGGWSKTPTYAKERVADRARELCDELGQDAEILDIQITGVGNGWTGGNTIATGTVRCRGRAEK